MLLGQCSHLCPFLCLQAGSCLTILRLNPLVAPSSLGFNSNSLFWPLRLASPLPAHTQFPHLASLFPLQPVSFLNSGYTVLFHNFWFYPCFWILPLMPSLLILPPASLVQQSPSLSMASPRTLQKAHPSQSPCSVSACPNSDPPKTVSVEQAKPQSPCFPSPSQH